MTRTQKFHFIDSLDISDKVVLCTIDSCVKDFYNFVCVSCITFYDLKLLYVYSGLEYVKISFRVRRAFKPEKFDYVSFYYPFDKFYIFYESWLFDGYVY